MGVLVAKKQVLVAVGWATYGGAVLKAVPTDVAAHEAATSHLNLKPQPTEAQKEAGTYPKGHVRIAGLPITIENPTGSHRRPEWPPLTAHYGYIKRTEGADGDHVDVFLRNGTTSDYKGGVYVIDQWVDGAFDEHKCMVGWYDEDSARRAYLGNYTPGWDGIHAITYMSMEAFKAWLEEGDTTASIVKQESFHELRKDGEWNEALHPRAENGQFGEGASQREGVWVDHKGKALDAATQARLKELKVPPGWTNVKLNPDPNAKTPVKGKDSKGRNVYVRTAAYNAAKSAEKFARLREFNDRMPTVQATALKDMNDPKLSQGQRDTAAATYLISKTGLRPGSDTDTRAKVQAFGATTLQGRHVAVEGNDVKLAFVGKKGVDIEHTLTDKRMAAYLTDKGAKGTTRVFDTTQSKVLGYLKTTSGDKAFKTKDMRTWQGTVTAIKTIAKMPVPTTEKEYKAARAHVANVVSSHLGNTPVMALKAYIDPAVFSKWGR